MYDVQKPLALVCAAFLLTTKRISNPITAATAVIPTTMCQLTDEPAYEDAPCGDAAGGDVAGSVTTRLPLNSSMATL